MISHYLYLGSGVNVYHTSKNTYNNGYIEWQHVHVYTLQIIATVWRSSEDCAVGTLSTFLAAALKCCVRLNTATDWLKNRERSLLNVV